MDSLALPTHALWLVTVKRLVRFNFHKGYINGPLKVTSSLAWTLAVSPPVRLQMSSFIFTFLLWPLVLVFLLCSQPHMVM